MALSMMLSSALTSASTAAVLRRSASWGPARAGMVPGHVAAVLPGRREATGRGYGGIQLHDRPIKIACDRTPSGGANEVAPEPEFDFEYTKDPQGLLYSLFDQSDWPVPLSDKDEKLLSVAERYMCLLADAAKCLPPSSRPRLIPHVWMLYYNVGGIALRLKMGDGHWRMAVQLAEQLDLLRRLVSFACKSPLSLKSVDRLPLREIDSTDGSEVVLTTLLENLFEIVESEVKGMDSAAA